MKKGSKMSPESRAKVSAALRLRVVSEETRQKLRESKMGNSWNVGRQHSDETRRRESEAKKGERNPNWGKPITPERRAKLSAAMAGNTHGAGYTHTPEARAKMSAARRGVPKSEEHRRKIGEANQGRPFTEERRRHISEATMGRTISEEQRRKQSERFKGAGNPRWLGGIKFAPYCPKFNDEFKERVRNFFGRVCVECGAPENGSRHCVHHVNFRKDSCCAEEVAPLFVALCRACHTRTNNNREYWEEKYTTMINEKYGGQCYLPKQSD